MLARVMEYEYWIKDGNRPGSINDPLKIHKVKRWSILYTICLISRYAMSPYQNFGSYNAIVPTSTICYVVVIDLKRLQLNLNDCKQPLHSV
jgi:hypothetical protein